MVADFCSTRAYFDFSGEKMSTTQLLQQPTNNHAFKRQADLQVNDLAELVRAEKGTKPQNKRQKTLMSGPGTEISAP
jgi:hypothetical protein